MENKIESKEFKPYVPAEKITLELTVTSIIIGVFLAVVFGAANAYLGLRVGLTVSASIPAAVISMAVIRVIMKKDSILESNMVQTIGSAGESLASGAIFTLPALFLWANEGVMEQPSLITIALISLCAGFLGVVFMVPLRNALIVKEHATLPYPEGKACAEVLLAGEKGGASAKSVFTGMGFAALLKFVVDGLGVAAGVVTVPLKALKTEVSAETYPALMGVGYICGARISSYLFCGGMIAWFVLIPAIVFFGANSTIFPASVSIGELYEAGGASAIWSNYIRYIGAGAVAAGGIVSLIKSLPLIIKTFAASVKSLKNKEAASTVRTELDLSSKFIGISSIIMILVMWMLPQIPVTLIGAIVIVVFGFFFATVSSRMVGLIGASNNPISGMSIATLIISTALLKLAGDTGAHGMQGAIAIGSVICIIAAMSGDTSQDLKTGYILGATPKNQQIGEIIGTVVSAVSIGGVLVLLDKAWSFGSEMIPAPQATLMKMVVEGVMDGNLPWTLIFVGVFISLAFEVLKINSLPVAIGLYLPLELSTTIMIGGIIRYFADKKNGAGVSEDAGDGILFCSGMIAGEGIVGILLAVFAVLGVSLNISGIINTGVTGGVILLVVLIALIYHAATKRKISEV